MKLYLFTLGDCEVCATQKKIFKKFEKKHPEVTCITWDLLTMDWPDDKVQPPESTPSFLLQDPPRPVRTITAAKIVRVRSPNGVFDGEGHLELKQLEAWVFAHAQGAENAGTG